MPKSIVTFILYFIWMTVFFYYYNDVRPAGILYFVFAIPITSLGKWTINNICDIVFPTIKEKRNIQ